MYPVEMYARVCRACLAEGMSRSGNLPGVRTAAGHGTQDADLCGATRLPVPKLEPYTGVIHAILEADAGFSCRANQRGNLV